jgi:hypothetical protein
MTHFPDLPSHDDELLSAYIDGETTAEESARVVGDPRLRARLRELEGAAALVGAPVESMSAAARDAAIAAALTAARGASGDRASEEGAPAAVVRLDSHRRKRWTLASVAAVVLLVVIAAARMLQPVDNVPTTAFNQIESEAGPSAAEAPADRATADRAAPATEGYLGEFATTSGLASVVRSMLDARSASASAGAAGATRGSASPLVPQATSCSPADSGRGAVVFEGGATLGGQRVQVIVQEDGTGVRLLSVVDQRCVVLSAQAL